MQLFKKINNPWLSEIQESMSYQIGRLTASTISKKFNEVQWFLDNTHGLESFLKYHNIKKTNHICLFVTEPFTHGDISRWPGDKQLGTAFHIDQSEIIDRRVAINMPIMNTENSAMEWKDNVKFFNLQDVSIYGSIPFFYSPYTDNSDVLGSLELDQTYLVRTDSPHGIYNPNPRSRVVLSIDLHEDHIQDLWPEFQPAQSFEHNEFIKGERYQFFPSDMYA